MNQEDKHELVLYRINRAKETLKEVDTLIKNELWSTAINRIYYACFYAVSGLLLHYDYQVKTHAGARQMLGLHFIKTEKLNKASGKFYSQIFDMRHSGDYDDFVDYTKDDVTDSLPPAKELVKEIERLIGIS